MINHQNYKKNNNDEMLGYGMTLAYSSDNGRVICDLGIPSIVVNGGNIKYCKVGYSMNEAIVEIISSYVSGTKINYYDGMYAVPTTELLMFLKNTNIKVSEFTIKRVPYLINEQSKNSIDYPTSFINSCDSKLLATVNNFNCSSLTSEQSTYFSYLTMLVDNKRKSGVSEDEITT